MDESKSKNRKLNPKQEIFCQLYTKYWEATRAAREAGYSVKSAHMLGYQLLQHPLVQKRIDELKEHALKEIGCSRERVLLELTRIATVDLSLAFDEMGQMKPLKEIPEDVRRAIAGIEVNEIFDGQGDQKSVIGLAKKIKFWDKPKSLELLGKHMKLFADRLEVSGKDGGPIETYSLHLQALTPEELEAKRLRLREIHEKQKPRKEEGNGSG